MKAGEKFSIFNEIERQGGTTMIGTEFMATYGDSMFDDEKHKEFEEEK